MKRRTLKDKLATQRPPEWRRRWITLRNRILGNAGFQYWAARLPVFSGISRRHAGRAFDLVAGFCYSQVLLGAVQSGLLELLDQGPADVDSIARSADLSRDAAMRLARAAAALGLAEEIAPDCWMLGQQGVALLSNPGALAMVRHHTLLYATLDDPLQLLRQDRALPTELSRFWHYTSDGKGEIAAPYSQLMAASQAMVARETIAAYTFARHRRLLDLGGGHGAFVRAVGEACPNLKLGVFDLPPVLAGASAIPAEIARHPGDFFTTPLPEGYDCITLVRILHDHDDAQAFAILKAARLALPADGKVVVAEPMAGVRGAEAMGDAYFGMYLWAMNAGRPRTSREYGEMAQDAGFTRVFSPRTAMPIIASLCVFSF